MIYTPDNQQYTISINFLGLVYFKLQISLCVRFHPPCERLLGLCSPFP